MEQARHCYLRAVFLVAAALLKRTGAEAANEVENEQVVLDDADVRVTSWNSFVGGHYRACKEDSYNDGYKVESQDLDEDGAYATFTFRPPSDGCWQIEEYHPGSNPDCAKNLAQQALLDVTHCREMHKTFVIDQHGNPGQWNYVGQLMFYNGTAGKLSLRSSHSEQVCTEKPCRVVADAFRLTRVADVCPHAEDTCVVEFVRMKTKRLELASLYEDSWEGTLQIDLVEKEALAGINALDVLASKIQELKALLERHLGYKQVDILDFLEGRRLSSGYTVDEERRRQVLEDAALRHHAAMQAAKIPDRYHIPFVAGGWQGQRPVRDLTTDLNLALAGAGFQIKAASITWEWAGPKKKNKHLEFNEVTLIIALGPFIVFACTCFFIGYQIRRCVQDRKDVDRLTEKSMEEGLSISPTEAAAAAVVEDAQATAPMDGNYCCKPSDETVSIGSHSTAAPVDTGARGSSLDSSPESNNVTSEAVSEVESVNSRTQYMNNTPSPVRFGWKGRE